MYVSLGRLSSFFYMASTYVRVLRGAQSYCGSEIDSVPRGSAETL